MERRRLGLAATLLLASVLLGACGHPSTASVALDGSATVFPIANILAEDYGRDHPNVRVLANKCGTGGGFQRLARGEIDVATASRRIEPAEARAVEGGVVEVPLAFDGVTVVVHPSNPVRSLTSAQLRAAWSGRVDDWTAVGGLPGRIDFYGPTEDHGTYGVFTGAIDGRVGDVRRDVRTQSDYNVIVRAVAEDPRAMGYVGYDYYCENRDRVRAVAVDGVSPDERTIGRGTYRPLVRPLYLYVARRALARPEVRSFVEFALGAGGRAAVVEARCVPLPLKALEAARRRVAAAG